MLATSYDYAPLYRSSVGFDRIFNLLENAQRARSTNDWPPYDIVKTGDDSYRISIAVAGFAQDDLDISFQSNLPTVTGKKQEVPADGFVIEEQALGGKKTSSGSEEARVAAEFPLAVIAMREIAGTNADQRFSFGLDLQIMGLKAALRLP